METEQSKTPLEVSLEAQIESNQERLRRAQEGAQDERTGNKVVTEPDESKVQATRSAVLTEGREKPTGFVR